jgi:transcriptional regulator with XRE-family HTH domain
MYPNLKLAIFKKGIHQNHLSRLLGIDEANLSRIIRGYREPSESQRRLLVKYFEVDASWLFEKYEIGLQTAGDEGSETQGNDVQGGLNSEHRR